MSNKELIEQLKEVWPAMSKVIARIVQLCPDLAKELLPFLSDKKPSVTDRAATALEQADARIVELEASETQLIGERDYAEAMGTMLADAVAEYFLVDVGEYSNMNDPREVAQSILEGEYITDSDADRKNAALAAQVVTIMGALKAAHSFCLNDPDYADGWTCHLVRKALELDTKPADKVLAEHDAKVIERCIKAADEAYATDHVLDAIRALIAAPKENSNV